MKLSELRRELKAIGYKVKTSSNSLGKCVSYEHIESGVSTRGNVFSPAQREMLSPLFEYLKINRERIATIPDSEDEDRMPGLLPKCVQ